MSSGQAWAAEQEFEKAQSAALDRIQKLSHQEILYLLQDVKENLSFLERQDLRLSRDEHHAIERAHDGVRLVLAGEKTLGRPR